MRARRSAFTLIECLVMLTLVGAALAAISLTLHGLIRADGKLRDELAREQSLTRFLDLLHSDAHAALGATLVDRNDRLGESLQLAAADEKIIDYVLAEGGIERSVRRQNNILHRDTFPLARARDLYWQIFHDEQRDHPLITLMPRPGNARTTLPAGQINAAVGIE